MYFYSETSKPYTGDINVWNMNGTKQYLKHYDQLLFLNFVAKKGTLQERLQAEREIKICHKKLEFWRRHPKTDDDLIQKGVEELKANWREPASI